MGGLFAVWRTGVYYPERAALENNSQTITVTPTLIVRGEPGRIPGGSRYIFIETDKDAYHVNWASVPHNGMSAEEFIECLNSEPRLTLTVKGAQVCAVRGAEREYISVRDFNGKQKTESVVGTALLAFFALLTVIVFAAAVESIRFAG